MKKLILIFIILQSSNAFCQQFESTDVDTLYTIKDFALRNYDYSRDIIKKEKEEIISKKIKSRTSIYKSKLKDGREIFSKSILHYDSNGYKFEEEWINENSLFKSYKYDSLGNFIEESVYDKSNNLIEKTRREFDKFGNQIYYSLMKEGVEKVNLNNELLSNGNRIIKDYLEGYTYQFDRNGVLREYISSYMRYPTIKGINCFQMGLDNKIDTTFEDDNGDFRETTKFKYDINKLIRIETYEKYLKKLTKVSRKYNNQGIITNDTIFSKDTGGLSRLQLFKYLNSFLVEKIDSTILHRQETYKTYFIYNKFGKLIQKKLYGKFGNQDTLLHVFNVKYDDNQNVTYKSYYYVNSLYWQRNYTYDNQKHLTFYSYGREKPFVEIFNKYYSSGGLLESKIINYTCIVCEDGMSEETIKSYPRINIIKYNENGLPIEKLNYISQNILKEQIIYSYNNSQLILIDHFKDGIEIRKKELRYDSNRNLIFEHDQSFEKNNFRDTQVEYSYEFYKIEK